MLVNNEVELEFLGWHCKEFWLPESVVCMNDHGVSPRSASKYRWCRARDGKLIEITRAELTKYKGKQPITFGFYFGYGQVKVSMYYPECKLGYASVYLEPRNLSWQPPPGFGRKTREVRVPRDDPFPDRPFECYLLDENDWESFDNQMKQTVQMLMNGHREPAPEDILHVTVSFDSWVHYTRDIPFTPVNELSEVEAVMNEQLRSLILIECPRLNHYFKLGRFQPSFSEVKRLFA